MKSYIICLSICYRLLCTDKCYFHHIQDQAQSIHQIHYHVNTSFLHQIDLRKYQQHLYYSLHQVMCDNIVVHNYWNSIYYSILIVFEVAVHIGYEFLQRTYILIVYTAPHEQRIFHTFRITIPAALTFRSTRTEICNGHTFQLDLMTQLLLPTYQLPHSNQVSSHLLLKCLEITHHMHLQLLQYHIKI